MDKEVFKIDDAAPEFNAIMDPGTFVMSAFFVATMLHILIRDMQQPAAEAVYMDPPAASECTIWNLEEQ